jgi:hypothetical protein
LDFGKTEKPVFQKTPVFSGIPKNRPSLGARTVLNGMAQCCNSLLLRSSTAVLYSFNLEWLSDFCNNVQFCCCVGTFSNVYLAHLVEYPDEMFALKHIIPTSSPDRVEREVRCLQEMGWDVVFKHTLQVQILIFSMPPHFSKLTAKLQT